MAPPKASGYSDIWKVHAVLVLVQCSYAGSNILSKVAFTSGVDPLVFVLYRDIISILCLAVLAFFFERGQRTPMSWETVGLIVPLSFFGCYCAVLLKTYGIALAPATYGCLISITNPVFVFIISAATGLEEIHWRTREGQAKVLGVMTSVCGGILIPLYQGPQIIPPFLGTTHEVLPPQSELPLDASGIHAAHTLSNLNIENWQLGGFLLILVGLFQAMYWTLQVPVMKRYPAPVTVAAYAYSMATALLALTALATVKDHSLYVIPRFRDVMAIVYSGIIPSGVSFGLLAWAAFKSGPVLLASYKPLQPFATVSMAYLFLGESIDLGSILGFSCIMSGLLLLTWGQLHNRTEGGDAGQNSIPKLDDISNNKGNSDLEQPLLA